MNSPQDRIKFVYFDLGNVMLSFDPDRACRNVSSRFDVPVEQARTAVYDSGLQDRFEHGAVSGMEFAECVRRELGVTESQMPTVELLDAISDMFTPVESMEGVLHQVRQRGYVVGLLSNTCHAHWDWIQRMKYAVLDFEFDVTILSFDVGSMKPDAAIYVAAEQASGLPSDQILFLDDKQENVDAAKQRGWHASRCLGGPQALDALHRFGVLESLT